MTARTTMMSVRTARLRIRFLPRVFPGLYIRGKRIKGDGQAGTEGADAGPLSGDLRRGRAPRGSGPSLRLGDLQGRRAPVLCGPGGSDLSRLRIRPADGRRDRPARRGPPG